MEQREKMTGGSSREQKVSTTNIEELRTTLLSRS